MRNKKIVIPVAALVVVVVLAALGSYLYFFSGLHSTPKKLALKTATPAASSSASTDAVSASAEAGTWQVGTGSLAGYRASEKFANQTSSHDAVSRTSNVSGNLTLASKSGRLFLGNVTVTVQLADLKSVDTVAGLDVANRDHIVARDLDVTQYPTATFVASGPIGLPANLKQGQVVQLTVPGQLTVHGQTKPVTASIQAEATDGQIKVAGSIQTDMTEFGVQPPQVPITVVQPALTLEFQLDYTKAS